MLQNCVIVATATFCCHDFEGRNAMLFRILLAVLWIGLVAYTVVVIGAYGMTLVPIFFGDIARMNWPGQFNLDFSMLLVLSALWTAWRNKFSPLGLALSPVALFGGSGFLL